MNWKKNIESLRKRKDKLKLTQAEIAARSGIAQPHISKFFKAKHSPTLETYQKIKDAIKHKN